MKGSFSARAHFANPAFEACRWVIDTLMKTKPICEAGRRLWTGAACLDGEPVPQNEADGTEACGKVVTTFAKEEAKRAGE